VFECRIGAFTTIGTFMEIQKWVVVVYSWDTAWCSSTTRVHARPSTAGHRLRLTLSRFVPRVAAKIDYYDSFASISVCFRRTSTGVVHRPRTPAAPSRDIAYMTMFFEGSLTCGRRSWLLSVEAAHFVRAPLLLQAAGVRARRYERDSALREVVPADNDA